MTLLPEFRAQLHAAADRRSHRRRPRLAGRLSSPGHVRRIATAIPAALSILVAIGVAVAAIATLGHRHAAKPTVAGATPSAQVPSPVSLLPSRGGMRGLLLGATVAGSGSTLQVSFVQCTNCADSTPPDARELNWSATSTDGGRHWQTRREQVLLLTFGLALPEGRDVWQFGYAPHAGDPSFYVSHDSGRTYRPVRAPSDSGFQPVTLGDGEAWTLGVRCVHYRCRSSVLHGQAAGSRLTRTAVQPPGMPTRYAPTSLVVAGYGARAYVAEGGHPRLYVTDDDGHSWSQEPYPCPAGTLIRDLTATGGGAVWLTCGPVHPTTTREGRRPSRDRAHPPVTVRRSADGGRHWQTPDPAFHPVAGLVAASPQIAWADGTNGALERTTNAGRSWPTVLRGVGPDAAVDIASSTTATIVAAATAGTRAAHTRRTDLVAYRTVDGGSHWTHALIRLPTG